jgi:hypothetical protein
MFRFAFYFSVCMLMVCFMGHSVKVTNPFKPGSVLVDIGGNVKTLTRSTSCKSRYWGNNQENACTCCIIKQGLRKGGKIEYNEKSIPYCIKRKHCTEEVLVNMAHSLDTSYNPDAPELFVGKIIHSAKVVATSGTIGKEYHEGGKLTPQGVIVALSTLARQHKIRGTARQVEECFKVEPLSDKGSQTIQTFMVSQNTYCNRHSQAGKELFDGVYIVKELGKGQTEIKNTTRVKESFLGKYNLANPDRPKGFPAIALDETSFSYKDHAGTPHYLAVLTLSPGLPIFKILKNFAESYKTHSDNGTLQSPQYKSTLTKARHAMASLGGQVGRLHATYMTRDKKGRLSGKSNAVHGDMHSNNIFEDEQLNVVFIDAETFAIGLKSPRSVGKDLLRIYLFSTIRNAAHQNARKGNVKQAYWHEQIIKPFLLEYILSYTFLDGSYNKENFEDVMKILRSTFSVSGSGKDPEAVFVHAGLFRSMQAYRKYMTPLLKELEEAISTHPNPIELSLQGPSIQGQKVSKPWRHSQRNMGFAPTHLQKEILHKRQSLKSLDRSIE